MSCLLSVRAFPSASFSSIIQETDYFRNTNNTKSQFYFMPERASIPQQKNASDLSKVPAQIRRTFMVKSVCLFAAFCLLTRRTQPLKEKPVPHDLIAGCVRSRFIQLLVIRKRSIDHRSTPQTEHMIMNLCSALIAIRTRDADMIDLPFL